MGRNVHPWSQLVKARGNGDPWWLLTQGSPRAQQQTLLLLLLLLPLPLLLLLLLANLPVSQILSGLLLLLLLLLSAGHLTS